MENRKTKDTLFNTIPHSIREDFRDPTKSLGVPEKNLLLHLRMVADMFGFVHTTADQLRSDVFSNKIKRSTVNDHLLSLRALGHITYADRKGNGGSFQIRIDKWLGKNGVWSNIHTQKNEDENGGEVPSIPTTIPEVSTEVDIQKRRSNGLKRIDFHSRKQETTKTENGGTYNDKDKENDKNHVRSSIKEVRVQDFIPKSEIDDRLRRIAESIGEEYMGFVFWVYGEKGDDGIFVMQKVTADLFDKPNVRDKKAYFNSEVRRQLSLNANTANGPSNSPSPTKE